MPRLQQLRYLVALADTLSFSKAARVCHVTQPTLSMQLREMEERLGALLVERTRTRVVLTPVGEEIAARARTVLAGVEDIREIARAVSSVPSLGALRIGVVPTVGAYVLSLAVPSLRAAHPELRILVGEDRFENLPRKLKDGTHDALLLPERPEDGPDFASRLLLREPLHLVMPADHPLAAEPVVPSRALRGESILSMERGHRLHDPIALFCEKVGAHHATDYSGTTLDMLRLMVTAGMGLTLLPALYVRSDVLRETLVVARPLASDAPVRDISMVWRRTSPRHATFEAVAEIMCECLAPWGRPDALATAGEKSGEARRSIA